MSETHSIGASDYGQRYKQTGFPELSYVVRAAGAITCAPEIFYFLTDKDIDEKTVAETFGGPGTARGGASAIYGSLVGLKSQPLNPVARLCIVEVRGGTDKGPDGHRRDSIPIANAVIDCGAACEVVYYSDNTETLLKKYLDTMHGIIVRVNPAEYAGVTRSRLEALLMAQKQRGAVVMSTPDVQRSMGAKDALCRISKLRCGLEDTLAYYSAEELDAGFRMSMAFQPRVVKQNRGSQGEGIWVCKLKDESAYCKNFGDRICGLDEMLVLVEACDNHVEEHTVGEFLEFCVNGRTAKSGKWTSRGKGKYLTGGKGSGGQMVDQRFMPRIAEGEVRCLMVGPNLVELVHKKPKQGSISATLKSGAVYTKYPKDAPEFAPLVSAFNTDRAVIMQALGVSGSPLPLVWTADFIFGPKDAEGNDTFVVGEFNCSCVGITRQLDLAGKVGRTAVNAVLSGRA